MSLSIGRDPNAYAQQYATQNNISLEEAKTQLKAKYGDPEQKDVSSIFNQNGVNSSSTGSSTGIMDLINSLDDEEDLNKFSATELFNKIKSFLTGQSDETKSDDTEDMSADAAGNVTENTAEQTAADERPDPSIDPNTYAQQYATKHGITLEKAKEELSAKFGDPVKPDKNENA